MAQFRSLNDPCWNATTVESTPVLCDGCHHAFRDEDGVHHSECHYCGTPLSMDEERFGVCDFCW